MASFVQTRRKPPLSEPPKAKLLYHINAPNEIYTGIYKGTPRYSSINAHLGLVASPNWDFESLCYMWAFLNNIQLPWSSVQAIKCENQKKEETKNENKKNDNADEDKNTSTSDNYKSIAHVSNSDKEKENEKKSVVDINIAQQEEKKDEEDETNNIFKISTKAFETPPTTLAPQNLPTSLSIDEIAAIKILELYKGLTNTSTCLRWNKFMKQIFQIAIGDSCSHDELKNLTITAIETLTQRSANTAAEISNSAPATTLPASTSLSQEANNQAKSTVSSTNTGTSKKKKRDSDKSTKAGLGKLETKRQVSLNQLEDDFKYLTLDRFSLDDNLEFENITKLPQGYNYAANITSSETKIITDTKDAGTAAKLLFNHYLSKQNVDMQSLLLNGIGREYNYLRYFRLDMQIDFFVKSTTLDEIRKAQCLKRIAPLNLTHKFSLQNVEPMEKIQLDKNAQFFIGEMAWITSVPEQPYFSWDYACSKFEQVELDLIYWQLQEEATKRSENENKKDLTPHPLHLLNSPVWASVVLFTTLEVESNEQTDNSNNFNNTNNIVNNNNLQKPSWKLLSEDNYNRIISRIKDRLIAMPRLRILSAINRLLLIEVGSDAYDYLSIKRSSTAKQDLIKSK